MKVTHMYIYDQRLSGEQSPVERASIASQSVHHPLYPRAAHLIDEPGTHGIGRDVSLVDMDYVLRMNRQFAESLGWQPYRDRIAKLLGLPITADNTALAEAVAHWQRQNKLPRTGIINHVTWFRLQIALGLLAPPFPRAALDENHLTNLLFHTRHPERHLAPLKKEETVLKTEWRQLRERLVIPVLRQAPVCEASGPDFEQLADYLRWFNGELRKTTPDPKRLGQLRNLIRLQVKVIIQSLNSYIASGCNEPNLETLRLLVQALPWPNDTDVQAQRAALINSIQQAQKNALDSSDTWHKKCQ